MQHWRRFRLPKRASGVHICPLTAADIHRLAEEAGQCRALSWLLAYSGIRWGESPCLTTLCNLALRTLWEELSLQCRDAVSGLSAGIRQAWTGVDLGDGLTLNC
jgi:hypothetical protein